MTTVNETNMNLDSDSDSEHLKESSTRNHPLKLSTSAYSTLHWKDYVVNSMTVSIDTYPSPTQYGECLNFPKSTLEDRTW